MSEVEEPLSEEVMQRRHRRAKMGIAVVAVVASFMLFAGLISALMVSSMDKFWVVIKLPKPFFISTIVIVLSSISLFFALSAAKKNNQKLVKASLLITLLLAVVFGVFQTKGWMKMMSEGKMVAENIFYSYGSYGSDFVVLKNGKEISYDGYDYLIGGEKLDETEVTSLKNFAYQISGDRRRETLDNYQVENYGDPYSIKRLAKDSLDEVILEFKDNKVFANSIALLPNQQKDLFRFAFGIYREMPYFIIKGTYGEDFYLLLNNEKLDFQDRRLYYPERDLNEAEIHAIEKKVFQGGVEYEVRKGEVFENGNKVDLSTFETFLDLNDGIQVHVKNGKWTQMRQELNDAQYSEFYQASNVASSYIWMFTVLHVFHVLIAFFILLAVVIRSFKGYYNQNNQLGLKAVGVVWHFLGALWVILFILLQYFH